MKAILLAVGLVIGVVVGVVTGATAMHFLDSPFIEESPVNFQTIYFLKADIKIYTVARVWGWTADHEEVRHSKTNIYQVILSVKYFML